MNFCGTIPFHVVAVLGSFGLAGKTQPMPPAMKRCSVRNSSLASSFRLRTEMFRCEKGWFRISVIGCHITEYFKHLVLRKSSINAFFPCFIRFLRNEVFIVFQYRRPPCRGGLRAVGLFPQLRSSGACFAAGLPTAAHVCVAGGYSF